MKLQAAQSYRVALPFVDDGGVILRRGLVANEHDNRPLRRS